MLNRIIMLGAALGLACSSAMADLQPVFLGDNNTSLSSIKNAQYFTAAGSYVYFTAEGALGNELYRTDGTSSGVKLVKDLTPGTPGSYIFPLMAFRDSVYFVTLDSAFGNALWKSDGTSEGTISVAGRNSADPYMFFTPPVTAVASSGIIAVVNVGSERRILTTDGSSTGTTLLADYVTTSSAFIQVDDHVLFSGASAVHGWGWFRTDGTEAGTRKVDFLSNSGRAITISYVASVGEHLLISGTDGNLKGTWTTPAFDQPAQFLTAATPNFTEGCVLLDGMIYFSAAADSSSGFDLWKTDLTPQGTERVKDIPTVGSGRPRSLQRVGNRLVFRIDGLGPSRNSTSMWASDGTESGTVQLLGEAPGSLRFFASAGGRGYFDYADLDKGSELWVTDGTDGGTTLAHDLVPGPGSSYPRNLTSVGDSVYLSSYYGSPAHYVASITATDNQLNIHKEINPSAGFEARNFVTIGSKIYFSAWDGVHGFEPWVTDGTPQGTHLIADVEPGAASSYPESFTAVGPEVFFLGRTESWKYSLYKTNGTHGGTNLVTELNLSYPFSVAAAGNHFFINGAINDFDTTSTSSSRTNLWRSNGTAEGTYAVEPTFNSFLAPLGNTVVYCSFLRRLKAADPVSSATIALSADVLTVRDPQPFVYSHARINDTIYLAAASHDMDYRLWRTDGTASGTLAFKNLTMGTDTIIIGPQVGNHFFLTNEFLNTVWISDGTDNGTVAIGKEGWLPGGMYPKMFAALGDKYVFSSYGQSGYDPWITDGTSTGTYMLKDLNPSVGNLGRRPAAFVSAGNYVYLAAHDDANGFELWRTDGTATGTVLIADINPGPEPSMPIWMGARGDLLYFSAYDPIHGTELRIVSDHDLWPEVLDVLPGSESSGAGDLMPVGNYLVFTAQTPATGAGLWSVPLANTSDVPDWQLY